MTDAALGSGPQSGPTAGPTSDGQRQLFAPVRRSDKTFRAITTAAAFTSLVVMALIAFFLFKEAWPSLNKAGTSFFTAFGWTPDEGGTKYGIAAMLFGTVMIATIALLVAFPVSVGCALFINEYAPLKIRRPLISLIDLLAAIPSLIFGLWGLAFLQPRMNGLTQWMNDYLGFIPMFKATLRGIYGSSIFVSGIILAIMIVPIITSVSRSVMAEVPRVDCEAALALGGTRAGMVREVVLPFAKSGLVGSAMLGLGRALGETIAVALILSNDFRVPSSFTSPGGASVAGTIANKFSEASTNGRSALIAAGLVLFVVTLLVNIVARAVVSRSKKPASAGRK